MFLLLLLRHAVEMGSGKEPKSRGNPNEGIFFLCFLFSVFIFMTRNRSIQDSMRKNQKKSRRLLERVLDHPPGNQDFVPFRLSR